MIEIKKDTETISKITINENPLKELIKNEYSREKVILDIVLHLQQIPIIENLKFNAEPSKPLYTVCFCFDGKKNIIEAHLSELGKVFTIEKKR
jgi:hypothetical protein